MNYRPSYYIDPIPLFLYRQIYTSRVKNVYLLKKYLMDNCYGNLCIAQGMIVTPVSKKQILDVIGPITMSDRWKYWKSKVMGYFRSTNV